MCQDGKIQEGEEVKIIHSPQYQQFLTTSISFALHFAPSGFSSNRLFSSAKWRPDFGSKNFDCVVLEKLNHFVLEVQDTHHSLLCLS